MAMSAVRLSDMKKVALVVLASVALVLSTAGTSHAWRNWHGGWHGHGGRVVIGVGPWWGPGPWPYWYPPYYAYPYYPYPPVAAQEPPEYVEQPRTPVPQPGQPSAQAEWYYCPSAKAYYPDVQNCPEEWVRVPPRSQ